MTSFHLNSIRKQKAKEWLIRKYGNVCANTDCDNTDNITIDHIVPRTVCVDHNIYNLQLLCKSCNSSEQGTDVDGQRRWKYVHIRRYKHGLSMDEIASEIGLTSGNSLSVWLTRQKNASRYDTIDIDFDRMIQDYGEVYRTDDVGITTSDMQSETIKVGETVKASGTQQVTTTTVPGQGWDDSTAGTVPYDWGQFYRPQVKVPFITFTDLYNYLKDNPDFFYYEYFMKKVGRQDIEQIRNDQGKLEKFISLINSFLKDTYGS